MYKICRCGRLIPNNIKYCNKCSKEVEEERKNRLKAYKARRTDKKEQRFYSTKEWLTMSEVIKRHYLGCCVVCILNKNEAIDSNYTHHIVELKEDWTKRLDRNNLIPLCDTCHKQIHRDYLISEDKKREVQRELKIMLTQFKEKYI